VEPAAVASLAGSAAIVVGAALPLAVTSPLDALTSAFWVVAVLTAWVLLLGAARVAPAGPPALPLGGLAEAGYVLLGAALAFAAVSSPLGSVRGGVAAAATAAILSAAVLLVVPGARRATAGSILSLLAAPLVVSAAGVALEQAFVVAVGLGVLGIAAAGRAFAGATEPAGRPGPGAAVGE
jgi:hypothetical protein